MKKLLILAGLLAACVQLAGPPSAEGSPRAKFNGPAAAGTVLWQGVSALYHFAADPHRPFRAELASDYFDDVLEFERQLKLLKDGGRTGEAVRLAAIEVLWVKFKAAGAEIIRSGLQVACCTSLQLARVRERAEEVEAALMSRDLALAQ